MIINLFNYRKACICGIMTLCSFAVPANAAEFALKEPESCYKILADIGSNPGAYMCLWNMEVTVGSSNQQIFSGVCPLETTTQEYADGADYYVNLKNMWDGYDMIIKFSTFPDKSTVKESLYNLEANNGSALFAMFYSVNNDSYYASDNNEEGIKYRQTVIIKPQTRGNAIQLGMPWATTFSTTADNGLELIYSGEKGCIFNYGSDITWNRLWDEYIAMSGTSVRFDKLNISIIKADSIAPGYKAGSGQVTFDPYAEVPAGFTRGAYPIFASLGEDGQTLLVHNLYGNGLEKDDDITDIYTQGYPATTLAPVTIKLCDDYTVEMIPGHRLNLSPEISTSTITRWTHPVTTVDYRVWSFKIGGEGQDFTGYIPLDPDDFPQGISAMSGEEKDDALKDFKERLERNETRSITGTWKLTPTAHTVNPHWDRPHPFQCKVTLDPHCLMRNTLHTSYRYSYKYQMGQNFMSSAWDVEEPLGIEQVKFTVPVEWQEWMTQDPEHPDNPENAVVKFKLNEYGDNLHPDPSMRYLSIKGELTGPVDNVSLFIVRGKLGNYTGDEMTDTDKGHAHALMLPFTEEAAHVMPRIMSSSTSNDGSTSRKITTGFHLSTLPDNPVIQGSPDTYTLYARYPDMEDNGGYRFVNVATLRPENINTHVQDPQLESQAAFNLDGNLFTALQQGVIVSDFNGHIVGQLKKGATLTLTPGSYVIYHPQSGQTRKIIID